MTRLVFRRLEPEYIESCVEDRSNALSAKEENMGSVSFPKNDWTCDVCGHVLDDPSFTSHPCKVTRWWGRLCLAVVTREGMG